jgi:hypothetical protein
MEHAGSKPAISIAVRTYDSHEYNCYVANPVSLINPVAAAPRLVAQWTEHWFPKPCVAGSNPVKATAQVEDTRMESRQVATLLRHG